MNPLSALAESAAAHTGEPVDAWSEFLEAHRPGIRAARLDQPGLRRTIQATDSMRSWGRLIDILSAAGRRHPGDSPPLERIQVVAEASPFSLDAWLQALLAFSDHLAAQDRQADFPVMLGYLECVAESSAMQAHRPGLVAHLEDMLEAHGFAGG